MSTNNAKKGRVRAEAGVVKSQPRGRRRGQTAARPASIFELLTTVETLVHGKLGTLGLERFLLNGGKFRLRDPHVVDGVVVSCGCLLEVAPGLGVVQPLVTPWSVHRGQAGALREWADAIVAEVVDIHARRESHAAARASLRQATEAVVAEAAREGLVLEVLSIEATDYDPLSPRRGYEIFDVEMLMLGDDYGPIQMDRYTMDAEEGGEFSRYLRGRILPEQRQFAAILAAGQDSRVTGRPAIPAAAARTSRDVERAISLAIHRELASRRRSPSAG